MGKGDSVIMIDQDGNVLGGGGNAYQNALNLKPQVITVNAPNKDPFGGINLGGPQAQMSSLNKGKLNLSFYRDGADIAETLWVPVFGPTNIDTQYNLVLNRLNKISAGMVVDLDINKDGSYTFSYTKGGQTDTVVVQSTSQTTYAEINKMIQGGGYFMADFIRYVPEASVYASQFAAGDILATNNTISGMTNSDTADVGGEKSPDQFQNPIIDVYFDEGLAVDTNYTLVVPVSTAQAAKTFNWYIKGVKFKSPSQFTRTC